MSGVTTAIIVGASAATSIASAKMASNASRDAAQTQATSANQALDAQRQGYQQQRQDFAPYQQQGAAAIGRLGQTAGTYTGGMPSQPPLSMASLGNPAGDQMPQQPSQDGAGGQMVAQGIGPGQMAPDGMQGGTVRVRAPTGEVAILTPAQARAAVAKGARVMS